MNNKYYTEPIEKNTRYRNEYLKGIESFLQREKVNAETRRAEFIQLETYRTEQENYRNRFAEMLGFPLNLKRETPVLSEMTFVAKNNNVNISRMQLIALNGIKLYGIYFEQVNTDNNTPFIIGLHGGSGTPELISSMHKDSANYNHLVCRLTDKGANVFVPQLLLWDTNEYGDNYDRILIDGRLRQLGGSITALELYLLRGSIDYFVESGKINPNKIGCCGLSYGGMYALHLAALDTRIKSCYSCSWVTDIFVYSWADWSYKNAQNMFSASDVAGLIAPRNLVVAMGDKDNLFDWKLTQKECEKIQDFYRVFNSESRFKYIIFDGVHESDKNNDEIDFLMKGIVR